MPKAVLILALALGLYGCGSSPVTPTAQQSAAVDEIDAPNPSPSAAKTSAKGVTAEEFSSRYSKLDTENCAILSQENEEGRSAAYRCAGLGKVAIFVQESDLRSDLDAGVRNHLFETTGPYNEIMETVEWRLRGGKPFAVIFRYDVHSEIGPQRTALAVEKIGRAGAPGCRVGHVAGSHPNANVRARQLADLAAPSFECTADDPQIIGDTTLTSLGG